MKSVNEIILIGNIGRDPEVRKTTSGTLVATTSVATNRRKREGDDTERTDWHRVTAWGKLAEIFEKWVKKGDKVYIRGELQYDSFERDGVKIPTSEIVVRDLTMLGSTERAQ